MVKRAVKPAAPDSNAVIRAKYIEQGSDPVTAKKAIDDATNVARALWLSFLIFGTYLVITFAGVTHRDLFLETPIVLPVLNAKLPLVTFFWVAPILFVIFHLYLLLSLKLLADQVHHYVTQMEEVGLDPEAQDRVRLHLPNFVVVQALGGTSGQINCWAGRLVHITAFLTIVMGPLILLLFTQLMFLPYHGWWVTMAQRAMVAVDLILMWYFWPKVRGWKGPRKYGEVHAFFSFLVLMVSIFVLSYPGELLYNRLSRIVFREPEKQLLLNFEAPNPPESWKLANTLNLENAQLILESEVQSVIERRKIADNEFAARAYTLDLRNRDLRGALLSGADLRFANLDSANLIGSLLLGTQMTGANFSRALLRSAVLDGSNMRGAELGDVDASGASANFADLRGAAFEYADLRGASFAFGLLDGATFDSADLTAADFSLSSLDGVAFVNATLIGTNLSADSIKGTTFAGSSVWMNEFQVDSLQLADISSLDFVNRPHGLDRDQSEFTLQDFKRLLLTAIEDPPWITVGYRLEDFAKLDPRLDEMKWPENWLAAKARIATNAQFRNNFVRSLVETACSEEGSPFVAQNIVRRLIGLEYDFLGSETTPLIEQLLSGCPGTEGMPRFQLARIRSLGSEIAVEGNRAQSFEKN